MKAIVPHQERPIVPALVRGTLGHALELPGQARDIAGTESLKTLAFKVLKERGAVGQTRDSDGTTITRMLNHELFSVGQHSETPNAKLRDSMARLESAGICIAIAEDGRARIIQDQASVEYGETRYLAHELFLYVCLSQRERLLFHGFKREFGATAGRVGASMSSSDGKL